MKDRCLETRATLGGLAKLRRYETAEGARYTTYEVPASVIGFLGRSRLRSALQQAARTREMWKRHARVRLLLRDGWKPDAIAHEMGMSVTMVRRIRAASQRKE